jgi:hypothetical protein
MHFKIWPRIGYWCSLWYWNKSTHSYPYCCPASSLQASQPNICRHFSYLPCLLHTSPISSRFQKHFSFFIPVFKFGSASVRSFHITQRWNNSCIRETDTKVRVPSPLFTSKSYSVNWTWNFKFLRRWCRLWFVSCDAQQLAFENDEFLRNKGNPIQQTWRSKMEDLSINS